MTITGVGIRLDLTGPRPSAPPHSLVNTPGVLVDGDGGRWMNGVNLIGYPEDVPLLWEICSTGTDRVKEDGEVGRISVFDPFAVYVPIQCSAYGVYQELQGQAEAVLEASWSFGVEQALSQGVDANPYFGDANLDILGGGAVASAVALSYLENAIGATGRRGMIHATPAIVSAWMADKLIDPATLETANGTPVVSGDGYIGTDPDSGSSPSAGQDWAFATGPVEVRSSPIAMTTVSQSLDRSDNVLTFRAERNVLAIFDGALQAGILVDWSP